MPPPPARSRKVVTTFLTALGRVVGACRSADAQQAGTLIKVYLARRRKTTVSPKPWPRLRSAR